MFVGHYAVAIAIAATCKEKGALTYLSLASVIPDVLMLSTGSMGSKLNFHVDLGFLFCLVLVVGIGINVRYPKKLIGLSVIALLLHLLFDYPYMAQDSSNLYASPWLDFGIEISMLAVAAVFYMKSRGLKNRRLYFFAGAVCLIAGLQGIWNFSVSGFAN